MGSKNLPFSGLGIALALNLLSLNCESSEVVRCIENTVYSYREINELPYAHSNTFFKIDWSQLIGKTVFPTDRIRLGWSDPITLNPYSGEALYLTHFSQSGPFLELVNHRGEKIFLKGVDSNQNSFVIVKLEDTPFSSAKKTKSNAPDDQTLRRKPGPVKVITPDELTRSQQAVANLGSNQKVSDFKMGVTRANTRMLDTLQNPNRLLTRDEISRWNYLINTPFPIPGMKSSIRKQERALVGRYTTPLMEFEKPEQITAEFDQLVKKINDTSKSSSIEEIAKIYQDFVFLSPYTESSGKTSRILLDYLLMKADFPPLHHQPNSTAFPLFKSTEEIAQNIRAAYALPIPEPSRIPVPNLEVLQGKFAEILNTPGLNTCGFEGNCESRAHQIAFELAATHGIATKKIYVTGTEGLIVPIRPNTPLFHEWSYHVATLVPVTGTDGSIENYILDPVYSNKPVLFSKWKKWVSQFSNKLKNNSLEFSVLEPQQFTPRDSANSEWNLNYLNFTSLRLDNSVLAEELNKQRTAFADKVESLYNTDPEFFNEMRNEAFMSKIHTLFRNGSNPNVLNDWKSLRAPFNTLEN